MHSSKLSTSKLLGLGVIAGLMSASVFAEPAIQPGDTLESLSQAKVSTTVNGQPGSIQELAASGQITIIGEGSNAAANAAPAVDAQNPEIEQAPAQTEVVDPSAQQAVEATEAPIESSAENPVNAAPEAPVASAETEN